MYNKFEKICLLLTNKHLKFNLMKTKIIFLLCLCVFCYNSVNSQEHLKFKGIPINGNVNAFSKELAKQGFTISNTKGSMVTLIGEFVGKRCEITVVGTKKTFLTWKLYIEFNKLNSWSALKSDYKELKEQFTKKYGDGEYYEFFSKPYYEGDGYETTALSVDKCTWSTYWKVDMGNIDITIEGSNNISISYQDMLNTEVMRKEKSEVISNDI